MWNVINLIFHIIGRFNITHMYCSPRVTTAQVTFHIYIFNNIYFTNKLSYEQNRGSVKTEIVFRNLLL